MLADEKEELLRQFDEDIRRMRLEIVTKLAEDLSDIPFSLKYPGIIYYGGTEEQSRSIIISPLSKYEKDKRDRPEDKSLCWAIRFTMLLFETQIKVSEGVRYTQRDLDKAKNTIIVLIKERLRKLIPS